MPRAKRASDVKWAQMAVPIGDGGHQCMWIRIVLGEFGNLVPKDESGRKCASFARRIKP
jgi:hypothetical protein